MHNFNSGFRIYCVLFQLAPLRLKCENNSKEKCMCTLCNSAVVITLPIMNQKKEWMSLVVKLIELCILYYKSRRWPLHLELTQRWPLFRYSTRFLGMLSLSYRMSLVFITLAASSNRDGGLCVISDTNLTTNGLSLKDNWTKEI